MSLIVFNKLDTIVRGKSTDTSIIYVTHQRDRLDCITHRFEFVPGETGGYRVIKQKIKIAST